MAISACGGSSVDNTTPTITGTPNTTVTENTQFTFSPTANDANGDLLSFSITNKPDWASFNTATGQLTGTPTTTGSYTNIAISVSDGLAIASLPAFSIHALGSAVLSWSKPTLNEDGTTLIDLTGYVIYYGTSANKDELNSRIPITDGNTTTYTINDLQPGITYYFAIASVSSSGGEGKKSNPASKTIN